MTKSGIAGVSADGLVATDSRSPIDNILLQALQAVPFQLTTDGGVDLARRRFRELPRRPAHPEVRTEDRTIAGPHGDIGLRVYWPPDAVDRPPVVMYFHGGGFVVGNLDTHDGEARNHAIGAAAVVVSVDYRLAPEHPYPAGVDDAWAATQWVAQHSEELGADPTRFAVAGDSAGGTLAAVMAQHARDVGAPPIRFQLLWYPPIMWDFTLPSVAENTDAPVLNSAAVVAFSRLYSSKAEQADPPPRLAPGRATDFAGLPAAYIAVAGHDPLRDDGARYANLLADAGVPVELHNAPTLIHGYLAYASVVPAATEAMELGLAALRRALYA